MTANEQELKATIMEVLFWMKKNNIQKLEITSCLDDKGIEATMTEKHGSTTHYINYTDRPNSIYLVSGTTLKEEGYDLSATI